MRKFFTLLALFSAVLLGAAENLIKNADFKNVSSAGLPLQWQVRGNADGIRPFDGGVTLGKEDQDIWLIQYMPKDIARDTAYEYSFTVTGKGKFRPYAEWSYIADGKKQLRSTGARFRNLSSTPENIKIRFTLPANAQNCYVVLNVTKGNEVTIKDLKMVKYIEPLLANADFTEKTPNGKIAEWATRNSDKQYTFAPGKVTLRSTKGTNAYVIQDVKKRLLPGATYRCTAKVSGKPGTRYRHYIESHFVQNGQRTSKAFNAQWLSLSKPEETLDYKFTMGNTAIGALFVLNIMDDAEVTFSDLTLELVSAPNPPIVVPAQPLFAGTWSGKNLTVKGNQLTIPRGSKATRWMVELVPGKDYMITHSSRGEGKSDSDSGFYFYDTNIRFTNGKTVKVAHEDTGSLLQNKSYIFTALTPTAVLEIAPCGVDKLFIREMQLRNAPAKAEIKPELVFYLQRNNIYSKLPMDKVDGYITNVKGIVSATVTFNGETVKAVKDKKVFRFTIKTAGLKVGSYKVTADLTDAKGGKSTAESTINVLKPAATEVTVGPNRLLYVNGEAFLPIGPWAMPNSHSERNIKFAAERGVNFLKTRFADAETFKAYLDHAHKYGMKVCFNTGHPSDASDGAFRTWLHGVESVLTPEILAHPALLCYFFTDEPFWVGYPLEVIARCYQALQKHDPYRPVWINAAPRGTYADQMPYAKLCDIYGVDIYPVPATSGHSHLEDTTIACVGKYALRKAEIAGDTKPIFMALQGFSWKAMGEKKESPRSIYPTAHENRFMAFDSLICEAASIGWWGTGYILVPEFYDVMYKQFDEFRRLYPILLNNASRRMENKDGIEYRIYYGKGYTVVIAANTKNAKVTSSLTGLPFKNGNATEWTFNKNTAVSNGKLADTFGAYDVRIYYQGKLPAVAMSKSNDMKRNPFKEDVMLRVNGRIYDGKGSWIWEASGIRKIGSTAVLRKEFEYSGKGSAVIHIAADDRAEVFCNGKKAGEVSDWTFMHMIELDSLVKPGKNILEIRAADGGVLPCGVLAEIHSGDKVYATDTTWQAAVTADGAFAPAGIVAPFGKEAWGKGVRFCPITFK
ncbi:MAG: hypothetical protein E7057_09050 [Lentisphaerae bacterium]|nr:hypothetical protein [Lentisphaerota bacterium]